MIRKIIILKNIERENAALMCAEPQLSHRISVGHKNSF